MERSSSLLNAPTRSTTASCSPTRTRRLLRESAGDLDGIPLAIELAAARAAQLPLKALAEKLHDRFAILTGGERTALPRQQTMRAVIDWSYNLLAAPEQRIFERLSVFAGGCALAEGTGVCNDEQVADEDVFDLLSSAGR